MERLIDIDHSDTRISAFLLFIQVAKAVLKYIDACLYEKLNLSISKLIAVQALSRAGDGMAPSNIARWTGTERHNITTLITRMKREGLVTAERDKSNKRFVNVKLTDKGKEVYTASIPVANEIFKKVMQSITEEDAALLKAKLTVIKANIYSELEGIPIPEDISGENLPDQ